MYKYKTKKIEVCPMGTLRDETVVDCYYFGFINPEKCATCPHNKKRINK